MDKEKTKNLAAEAFGNLFAAEHEGYRGLQHEAACLLLTLVADLTCDTREERDTFLNTVDDYERCFDARV